jgi:2-polyprenyl-6-methoxyphenol hydroxylase-like FAD-dependent oxidoreductase
MASSSEAFSKFSIWKSLNTPLTVTIIERDEPEIVASGRIDALHEATSQLGVISTERLFGWFDIEGAEFSIERGRIVVSRNDTEWLIFESEVED